MRGRVEAGSTPFVGDRENPGKVSVWRENHVKAIDGSIQGLNKEGKKLLTEPSEHVLYRGFKGNIS